MIGRSIPEPLYTQVLDLALKITNASEAENLIAQFDAVFELQQLYISLESSGLFDPFLTESLADFTMDDLEAIKLYELSLSQCVEFPDEPKYTKQLAIANRFIDLGDQTKANRFLLQAFDEANLSGDIDSAHEIEMLIAQTSC
jgi:hypothetical protein